MRSRWSPIRPPQPGPGLALAYGPPPQPLSPLSIFLREHVRVNEQLDISPNMSNSLSLEYPFLHLAVMFQVYFTCHLLGEPQQPGFPSLDNAHCEGGCFPLFYHTVSQTSLACPSPCGPVAQLMAGDSFIWPALCPLVVGSLSELENECGESPGKAPSPDAREYRFDFGANGNVWIRGCLIFRRWSHSHP